MMTSGDRVIRPGFLEMIVGLAAFAVLLVGFALMYGSLPKDQLVLQGIVGSTAGGVAGVGAFAAAFGLRIRALQPFGFRPAAPKWLMLAVALGVVGYGLNLVIQFGYGALFGNHDPQAMLHAAARGGVFSFVASLLGGALFTPFGEEILFRGVVANALNRYGALAGVGLSAAIFGLVHGVSVILPVAIMVGLLSGALFRKTGSVWPSILLHCIYNGANSVASALGVSPPQ